MSADVWGAFAACYELAPRAVRCTVHGPLAYDRATDTYACGLGGACMRFPASDLADVFALTEDEIKLTPPGASG